jgi:hypothetical protein
MGANLRRRGEQALKDDIRTVLREWRTHIGKCAVILTSIPKTMKSIVFEECGLQLH